MLIEFCCLVVALYSKGSGKNTNHAAIKQVDIVTSISYVGVQVYQQMLRQQFRSLPIQTLTLGTKQFQPLPSTSILYRFTKPSKQNTRNNNIELEQADFNIYTTLLDKNHDKLAEAIKQFAKRGPRKK